MKTYPISHPLDDGSKDWAEKNIKEMFYQFCDNLVSSEDIVITNKPFFRVFQDSEILIIGGGPSSDSLLLKDLGRYEFIWSMNNFFMNPALTRIRISLACFGANTNLEHPMLLDYLHKFSPYLGFEPHPKYSKEWTKGHAIYSDWRNACNRVNQLYKFTEYYNYKFAYQTKFWSRIGIGARMLLLAGHLGVKKVDFIGIDGYSSYKSGHHCFEKNKGKEALPSSIQSLSEKDARFEFLKEYSALSKELSKFKGVTSYKNLASHFSFNDIGVMLDQ